jgi:hypothetical protein
VRLQDAQRALTILRPRRMNRNHALALAKRLLVGDRLFVLDRMNVEQARQVRERVEIGIVNNALGRRYAVLHSDRVGRKAGLKQFVPCVLGVRQRVDDRDQLYEASSFPRCASLLPICQRRGQGRANSTPLAPRLLPSRSPHLWLEALCDGWKLLIRKPVTMYSTP